MLDPWTLDVPTSAPAVASVAGGSHLEMGKSSPRFGCPLHVLHNEATGRHLKASQTEGECVSLPVGICQDRSWEGGGVEQGQKGTVTPHL